MSRFRKLVMAAGLLLMSSSVFVACSDDEQTQLGAFGVNSLQTTSTTATAYWTSMANGNCAGYKVQIIEGTRENKGAVVVEKEFDPYTAHGTFEGLRENSDYVIATQGILAEGSGYSSAEVYEMHFMTAPIVHNIAVSPVTMYDYTYNEVDEEGNVIEITVRRGRVTASWDAIQAKNCGGYNVTLFDGADKVVSTKVIASAATNSIVFDMLMPSTEYYVGVSPRPSNACWYPSGEMTYLEDNFTTPAE